MSAAPRYIPNYTVDDYLLWEGDWQLIDGVPIAMSPSPFGQHERIVMEFATSWNVQLRDQGCDYRVYAGLDWIVNNNTVVRPDVMVVCGDQPQRHLEHAPVIVVEVLSTSTRGQDLTAKRQIYREHGVSDYLIVDPEPRQMEHVDFKNPDAEQSTALAANETIRFTIHKDCELVLHCRRVFE